MIVFAAASPSAHAQTLEKVEKSHTKDSPPKKDDSDGTPPPDSTPSLGEGIASAVLSQLVSHQDDSAPQTSSSPVVLCVLVPSLVGACLPDNRRMAISPYESSDGPIVRRSNYRTQVARAAELSLSGTLGLSERIYGVNATAMVWPSAFFENGDSPVAIAARWSRLREPSSPTVENLDFFRLHLGANVFAREGEIFELYPLLGASLLHGSRYSGAFDFGMDARVYPARPLVVRALFTGSIFASGQPLLWTSIEPGIVLGRVEFRTGIGWVFQSSSINLLSGTLAVSLRW